MKKVIIGVTGSFGTGKTTVSKIFVKQGAELIDADKLCHDFLNRGILKNKILKIFGTTNRKKIAQLVFGNHSLLKKLENILHPCVIKKIKETAKKSKKKIIIIDAPLLIESGLNKFVNKIIVVRINRDNQIKRIQKKLNLTKNQIIKRIKVQMPLSEKIKLADYVINNNGPISNTKKQVQKIFKKINIL